jgi:colanic acid biosynthesis glycosyl transferase WcaI
MTKRIILLTQWFDPEPNPRGMVFATELVKRGYEVEVITGFPNYPGGKVYPGYKMKMLQREEIDGVEITRLPAYTSHDESAWKRILSFVSFAISVTIYGVLFAQEADVMYVYHPPGVAAAVIRFFRRFYTVYDVQDMWPDNLRATGMINNDRIINFVGNVCKWVYQQVDRITVLSPGFKKILVDRGVPADKIDVIYNWCDEDALNSPVGNGAANFPVDKFTILFAGTMGKAQALESIIEAAEIVQVQQPQVNFVFLGAGVRVEKLKDMVQQKQLTNVTFLPKVSILEVGSVLEKADALLVHLKDDLLFQYYLPSKVQAYLAMGKPIVMGVLGDAADVIEKGRCGVLAHPENARSIADAAISLATLPPDELRSMGRRGKDFYDREMSVKIGVTKFCDIFERVAQTNPTLQRQPEKVV